VLVIYLLVYAGVVTLSLPGATLLTLVGGCLFGLWLATGLPSLPPRWAPHCSIWRRRTPSPISAGPRRPWLKRLSAGFQENALSYLLFLRLTPPSPFSSSIWYPHSSRGLRTFVLATFIGIIPGPSSYKGGRRLKSLLDMTSRSRSGAC